MGRYDWEKKRDQRAQSTKKSSFSGITIVLGIMAVSSISVAFTLSRPNETHRVRSEASDFSQKSFVSPVEEPVLAPQGKNTVTSFTDTTEKPNSLPAGIFAKCSAERVTCVVDGDTFWLNGEKIRIADIDTPEVSQPKCPEELALGIKATDRLTTLLNDGPFELVSADRDRDGFGRQLRVVIRNGKSLGEQLVNEGLAHRWNGGKEPWCR